MFWEILSKLSRFIFFWIAVLLILTIISVVVYWPDLSSAITAEARALFSSVFSTVFLLAIILFGIHLLLRAVCPC